MRVWGGEGGEMCSVAAADDVVMQSCLHMTSHKSLLVFNISGPFYYNSGVCWRGRLYSTKNGARRSSGS